MDRIWVVEPTATLDDSRWQGRRVWRHIVVRAENAGLAILTAEKFALEHSGHDGHPGNETPSPVAGPADAKLYKIGEINEEKLTDYSGRQPAKEAARTGVIAAEMMA